MAKEGLLENLYPVWKLINGKVEIVEGLLKNETTFELRNLGYVVKLGIVPDWWYKRKSRLMRLKGWGFSSQNFGKNNSNPYEQIINENFVIQTYPESLIIIARKVYSSKDSPYEPIQTAMSDVLDILMYLEQQFRFKFFPEGVPNVELRGNDYNRIKDFLATKCIKEGTKFLVETPKGKVWCDKSLPLGRESNTPDIQETLEKDVRDKVMNKPLLNSELQELVRQQAEQIKGLTMNAEMFSKDIQVFGRDLRVHIPAYEKLGSEVERINNVLESLTKAIESLKKDKV